MNRLMVAYSCVVLTAAPLAAQSTAAPRIDAAVLKGSVPIELVFLRDHGPLMVRMHVLKDGQPIHARWLDYLNRWYSYLDRNETGAVDETALLGAPNAASMRNLAQQGAFFPNRGLSLTLNDFGKSTGQTVSRQEFLEYYRKNNVSPVQTAIAPLEAAGPANDALFKALDANADGKLARHELEAGRALLALLDQDDDELVSLRELSPAVATVVGRGAQQLGKPTPPQAFQGTSFFHVSSESSRAGMAALLLARYDKKKRMTLAKKDIGVDEATFARLDENRNGSLDLMELAKFPQNVPAVELAIHVRAGNGAPPVTVLKAGTLKPDTLRSYGGAMSLALGDADITVQNLDANLGAIRVNTFNFIGQQLKAADTKMRGFVEMSDLQGPQYQFLRSLFPILDRNVDGKLTEPEAQTYFDLQAGGRDVMTSFFVQEQGRNLVQILDANRDGQLAPRELLNAWKRLAAYDKNGDGTIDPGELPRQFRVVFNPTQQPQAFVAGGMAPGLPRVTFAYPSHAPLWFRKMDRNTDGDVSRSEFLGTSAEFARIDSNADGLIDADEAAAVLSKR